MNYNKPKTIVPKTVAFHSLGVSPRRGRPRWSISYRVIAPIAMTCDAAIIVLMGVLSSLAYQYAYYYDAIIGGRSDVVQSAGLATVVAALFILIGKSRGLYSPAELLNLKSQITKISIKWVAVLLFLAAAAFTMKAGGNFSRGATILFAIFGLLALTSGRIVWRIILADGLAVRKFSGRKVTLIIEEGSPSKLGILEALARHGLEPAHQFTLPADPRNLKERKRVIAHAVSSIRGSNVEEVIIGANVDHWSSLRELLSDLRVLPIPVNLVPVGPTSDLFHLPSHTIGETVTIELQRGPRTLFERSIKRVIDVIAAGTALLLLLPLFIMTAIAIKLDSPGPVIFRQKRSGFNGRRFQIMKFRTMSVLEDGETVVQAEPNDKRVTRVGAWLRRTSIDELPQLFNVLQGQMSIVGPRPHALAHDNEFNSQVAKYAYRHHVKPGITGWAQVHGFRGRTSKVSDIEKRLELDLWYIDNWNLALDFKIALMTIIEIAHGENAY
jgi:putative colanic acid biosynthesis UDP-glucose lipid carrier transferase